MTVVELKKMVVDTSLNDLKHKIHYIIDGIASDKAFDQYNAKCGEADRLREALNVARRAIGDHFAPDDCYATGPITGDPFHDLVECPACSFIAIFAALQLKEGEK